ncbi:hypothetical protein P153DRAFT_126185 [Dothidotthia symphoricarpi CBS 119687]|uniref:Uncharacterized protein n=1 Tax=Dothidotthia symphoricarpi CBS 119687 TaxID=1392245 RepID=A0A6A5ZYU4_9PLEO|nr:uncharacterized protein P153DRAFT_126185 [Dothidotthia symphoricarpi CBS 119687]KAF2124729.1 hypothetical protein P153DRAFT_126185 [Dothidotthia symphoricarpi CBS 119687]
MTRQISPSSCVLQERTGGRRSHAQTKPGTRTRETVVKPWRRCRWAVGLRKELARVAYHARTTRQGNYLQTAAARRKGRKKRGGEAGRGKAGQAKRKIRKQASKQARGKGRMRAAHLHDQVFSRCSNSLCVFPAHWPALRCCSR